MLICKAERHQWDLASVGRDAAACVSFPLQLRPKTSAAL